MSDRCTGAPSGGAQSVSLQACAVRRWLQGTNINPVFFALFNIMGIYPALYAAILNPSARSRNKAWRCPPTAAGPGVLSAFPDALR